MAHLFAFVSPTTQNWDSNTGFWNAIGKVLRWKSPSYKLELVSSGFHSCNKAALKLTCDLSYLHIRWMIRYDVIIISTHQINTAHDNDNRITVATSEHHTVTVSLNLTITLSLQIETFFIRLSHLSGVDGLACMSTSTKRYYSDFAQQLRPLLDIPKVRL